MTEQTVLRCPRPLTVEDIAEAFDRLLPVFATEERGVFLVDHPLLPVAFIDTAPEAGMGTASDPLMDGVGQDSHIDTAPEAGMGTASDPLMDGVGQDFRMDGAPQPRMGIASAPVMDGAFPVPPTRAKTYKVRAFNYTAPVSLFRALRYLAVTTGGVLEIDGEVIDAAEADLSLEELEWYAARAVDPQAVTSFDQEGIHLRDERGAEISPNDVGAIAGWKKDPDAQRAVMDANARAAEVGELFGARTFAFQRPRRLTSGGGALAAVLALVSLAMIVGAQWLQSSGRETVATYVVAFAVITMCLVYAVSASMASPRTFRAIHWGIAISAPVVIGGLVSSLNAGHSDELLLIAASVFLLYLMVLGMWIVLFRPSNLMMFRARRAVSMWLKRNPNSTAWPVIVAGMFPDHGALPQKHSVGVLGVSNEQIMVVSASGESPVFFGVARGQCDALVDMVSLDLRGRKALLDMNMAGNHLSVIVRDTETLSAISVTPIDPKAHLVTHAGLDGLAAVVRRLRGIGVPVSGALPRR